MTSDMAGERRRPRVSRRQLRQPRLAQMVAAELRRRIVSGELADESMLPKQEDLLEEFPVSAVSLREALRILETEGLVTVVRGNVGGAIVHTPQAAKVTFMIGMVLQSREVSLYEVRLAIRQLESACAEACAARDDRDTAVLPGLRATLDRANEALGDETEYARWAMQFHHDLVEFCGNKVMQLVVGALEALWSAHVDQLASGPDDLASFAERSVREHLAAEHEAIYDCIRDGDTAAVATAIRRHLALDRPGPSYSFDLAQIVNSAFVREI